MGHATIETLVDDILIQILCGLDVPDILSVRQTNKRLCTLTRFRNVWHHKFISEVVECNLPIPGNLKCPLPSLSTQDLEWRTRRAMQLSSRWAKSGPDTISSFDLPQPEVKDTTADEKIDQLVLMPGGRQLLLLHRNKVACWQIGGETGRKLMAKREGTYVLSGAEGDLCRIVSDPSSPDMVAVSSSERPGSPAVVLSIGQQPVFVECHYPVLPGTMVGLYDRFILSEIPPTADAPGGIEVRDWQSDTESSGSVLLPCEPSLLSNFVAFHFFASHILIVWETCLTVFPIPTIPMYGQTIEEPVKIFCFAEPVAAPVSFTPCKPRLLPQCIDCDDSTSPSLTLVARPSQRPSGIVHTILTPLPSYCRRPGDEVTFPYRLRRIPEPTDEPYVTSCLGPSGRGVWVAGNAVRRCSPIKAFVAFEFERTVGFDSDSQPVCTFDKMGLGLDRADEKMCIDFDDGMGRFVVASGEGRVSVIDLA